MRLAVVGWFVAVIAAGCSLQTGALGTPFESDSMVTPGADGGVSRADTGVDVDGGPPPVGLDGGSSDGDVMDATVTDAGGADAGPVCTPSAETCDATDEDCDGAIDEDASCPCPRFTFGGSTYLFCLGLETWDDAQDRCRDVGYELVTVETAEEDDWLWDTIDPMTPEEVWIGLTDHDSEGTFVWPDGTVQRTPAGNVGYSGWASTAPDNRDGEDCVELDRGRVGAWEDVDCDQQQTFICEVPLTLR